MGNYFRGFHFFEISWKKWELILADFRCIFLNENFAGTNFRGNRKCGVHFNRFKDILSSSLSFQLIIPQIFLQ